MQVTHLSIFDVLVFEPRRIGDNRGWFEESYQRERYREAGVAVDFVQENTSFSAQAGTLRGLHIQLEPKAQGKLVRVITGRVWDVAVDARPTSVTFGKWVAQKLTASGGEQIWVPPGFLHGFVTMEHNTTVSYLLSDFYHGGLERSVRYDDPALDIKWPRAPSTVSERDNKGMSWQEFGDQLTKTA